MRQLKIAPQITTRDEQSVEKYLQEISKIPRITTDEEINLSRRIRAGDEQAFNTLVSANLRFVVSVAKQYQNRGLKFSDLINEGNIGLMTAAHRFDETKGFKFISYAVWWIRQSIMQALSETGRLVQLPLNKIGTINKVYQVSLALEQENEREPTPEEIAEIMGMDINGITNILAIDKYPSSLDKTIDEDQSVSMGDLMPSDIVSDTNLQKKDIHEEMRRVLKSLSPRDYDIIVAWFKFDGDNSMTIGQIMQKYDLSEERVRQIKERAIKRLRVPKRAVLLKALLE